MAFDGIVTKAVTCELKSIIGGKINKVFEPNKNNIVLGIYANGKNLALNICIEAVNSRIHLTTKSKPNPYQAPNFCMLLRKHLIGTRIKDIYSLDLERLVILELEGLNDLRDSVYKKLIIELMGKHSNVILVNNNNMIIDSLRHLDTFSNSKRDILPAHEYIFPTTDKKSFLKVNDFDEFYNVIISNNDDNSTIDKVIADSFNGFSISFVENTLKLLGVENSSNISKSELEVLYDYINKIVQDSVFLDCDNEVKNKLNFNVIYKENSKIPKDFFISYNVKKNNDSDNPFFLNFALDDFYSEKEENENFINYRNSILKIILDNLKKYSKRLKNINAKLKECDKMDVYRIYGELITSNLYQIKNENLDSAEVFNYYDNTNIIIPLDKKYSPSVNAKRYFKKYTKLKNTLEIVGMQKKQTEIELDYLESIVYELENSACTEDVQDIFEEISENVLFKDKLSSNKNFSKKTESNSKKAKEEQPLEYKIDNYILYVGKNNKQNDYLSMKFAKSTDVWFHTKDIHGSHAILKLDNPDHDFDLSNVDISVLERCAQITAFHSKAKNSSNVPVDYCFVKFVKKPRGSKPGMVIYTNNQTLNVVPASK